MVSDTLNCIFQKCYTLHLKCICVKLSVGEELIGPKLFKDIASAKFCEFIFKISFLKDKEGYQDSRS